VKLASQPLLPASPPFSHLKKLSSSLFAFPLFSQLYELLFPQALCFDNHLNCPGVYPLWSPCSDLRALCVALFSRLRFFRISSSCVFNSLHPLLRSWLSFSSLRSLFSATSSLFLQNTGGGGYPPAFSANLRALCASLPRASKGALSLSLDLPDRPIDLPPGSISFNCRLSRLPSHNAKIHSNSL
jgi:hypothetical protein